MGPGNRRSSFRVAGSISVPYPLRVAVSFIRLLLGFFRGGKGVGVLFAQQPLECVEAAGPEAFVESEPGVGAGERPWREAAEMRAAAHLAVDQPCIFQRLDVLRSRRKRDRERFGQLANGSFAIDELAQHAPARRVAESVKDRVELRCL